MESGHGRHIGSSAIFSERERKRQRKKVGARERKRIKGKLCNQ